MRALALVAVLLPGAVLAADSRIGVVVVGPDAAAVAASQTVLESKLATSGVVVRGASELGASLAGPSAMTANAWANDPAARSAFDAALGEARKAYFSDLMPQASAKLDEAAQILERTLDAPGSVRVKVPMWRAAVLLRQNQKEGAAGEVNVALLLVPNLELEPNSPPPVVQLLAEVRKKAPKPFTVTLTGVPANAVVKVDDVVLSASAIAVQPGSHVLDVVAPGYRPFNKSFDASADVTVEVSLAQAIGAAWEKLFDAVAVRGEVADAEKKSLDSLCAREKLDGLLLAAHKGEEIRAVLWRRSDGVSQASSGADAAQLGAWAAGILATRATAAVPKGTPAATPAATPVQGHDGKSHAGRGGMHIAAEGGLAIASWTRTVESEGNGEGYEVPGLTGAGPRIRLHAGTGSLLGELEASFVRFGDMETENPDKEKVTVPGGSMLAARLGGAYRHAFGQKDERSPAAYAGVGAFVERYAASDLEDGAGDPTRVFPSHARNGVDVRVGGMLAAGPATLLVELGVAPMSTWNERPRGATGKNPRTAPDPLFRVGADLAVGGSGRLGVEYSGEMRSVTYTGRGTSALAPEEATREEFLGVLGLSFRYRF